MCDALKWEDSKANPYNSLGMYDHSHSLATPLGFKKTFLLFLTGSLKMGSLLRTFLVVLWETVSSRDNLIVRFQFSISENKILKQSLFFLTDSFFIFTC